jgi:hypothetical protein
MQCERCKKVFSQGKMGRVCVTHIRCLPGGTVPPQRLERKFKYMCLKCRDEFVQEHHETHGQDYGFHSNTMLTDRAVLEKVWLCVLWWLVCMC